MSSLIASRYPVGIGVGSVFLPSTLHHLHQQHQQHQHHSRLAAAASSALSNAVVASQSDMVEVGADSMRGVLPGNAGAWPFPWASRPHGLHSLEHPSPNDPASSFSRISPTSGSFPHRGEFYLLISYTLAAS
jgi:hypothetical protein